MKIIKSQHCGQLTPECLLWPRTRHKNRIRNEVLFESITALFINMASGTFLVREKCFNGMSYDHYLRTKWNLAQRFRMVWQRPFWKYSQVAQSNYRQTFLRRKRNLRYFESCLASTAIFSNSRARLRLRKNRGMQIVRLSFHFILLTSKRYNSTTFEIGIQSILRLT